MKNKHSEEFYQARYNKLQQYAINKGIEFPYKSLREFKSDWNSLQQDGEKQILRTMKYGLEYGTKYKYALNEYQIAKEKGLDVTFKDIKKMTTTEFAERFQDEIMEMYEEQKAKGASSTEAGEFISTYWFGSE